MFEDAAKGPPQGIAFIAYRQGQGVAGKEGKPIFC